MIITKIIGGLGNQMFQYAAGYALSRRLNQPLKLDISDYKNYKDRVYLLNIFNHGSKILSCFQSTIYKKSNKYHKKLLYNIFNNQRLKYIKQPNRNYNTFFDSLHGNVYLDGYWQSEKYFLPYADEIRKIFNLELKLCKSSSIILKKIISSESVSIHFRRGDYINDIKVNNRYGVCSLQYYKKSINYFLKRFKHINFFIFSDDILWVENNLPKMNNVHFVKHEEECHPYEEVFLMSKCNHNIIANSTYSWWGAWLNNNPAKIIIAPEKWFKDTQIVIKDLIPENWIKL